MTKAFRKMFRLIIAGLGFSLAIGGVASWAVYTRSDSAPAGVFSGISAAVFVGIGLVAFGEHHYNKKHAKR